jgi:feruloyl-CoA synthase
LQQGESVAAALLELRLGPQRPLMMLSGNSIEQAVLLLAAEYAGVPVAPVSPAYCAAAPTYTRLKGVAGLAPPGAIFVQSGTQYVDAIAALDSPGIPVIAAHDLETGQILWGALATAQVDSARLARLAAARAAIGAEGTARILFTSGSTGEPKGVALSHGNLWVVAAYFADTFARFAHPQPVFLDWLPWHHVMGGVYNFSRNIVLGGTHYIDGGRPRPGQFTRTLDNLREVWPTIFNSVPLAWSMLAREIEHDPDLARSLFARGRASSVMAAPACRMTPFNASSTWPRQRWANASSSARDWAARRPALWAPTGIGPLTGQATLACRCLAHRSSSFRWMAVTTATKSG